MGLAAILLLFFGMAVPAWAHVTVHPGTVRAGSSDVELTFRCPNERDDANTVMLQVFLPANLRLPTVDVRPLPGWASTVQTQNLSEPTTAQRSAGQIVSEVTWKATAGGIAPDQYEDFDVVVGNLPDQTGQLVFKTLQTYSSGLVVRWIEVPVAGQPEPDTPAPILTLTAPGGSTPGATATHATADQARSSTSGLSIAALAVSVVAVSGVAALWLQRRRRRPNT